MTDYTPTCPTGGEPASGTCETITGVHCISGVSADGVIEYTADFKLDWDNQTTNTDGVGDLEWWCAPCCHSFFAPLPMLKKEESHA